jgi:MFS family permease
MDVTIVNVALPAIQKDLHAHLAGLQWILDAYTLVVASFLMLAGSPHAGWGSGLILGLFATAAAALLAFVLYEQRRKHPLLDLRFSVAVVKSRPCTRLAATTVPDTATPRAAPTCRLVDATAAATPACDRGIPATALLVIAGLTMPSPTPNSAYATNSQTTGVC